MGNYLEVTVLNTKITNGWLRELTWIERGEQIAAAFTPSAGVELVGCGALPAIGNQPEKANITFAYKDLNQALAEFLAVGTKLHFPSGTKLTHIASDWATSDAAFRTVATW